MNGPTLLEQHNGPIKTKVGAAYPGSHAIFRGHNLHEELRDLEWIDLHAYGILGRRLTPNQIEMINSLWVTTSYTDTRLWNNRVAALAGSARSSVTLGLSAAIAISDATVFGGKAGLRAFNFLISAGKRVKAGEDLQTIVMHEAKANRVYGYGRPINSTDERSPWIMGKAASLGLADGEHVKLAFEVEKILVAAYPQLKMNYAAMHAAFIADMGLTGREYHMLRYPTFIAGMTPCMVEALEKPEQVLYATKCNEVNYQGVAKRTWK